jgi:hypothetical protein
MSTARPDAGTKGDLETVGYALGMGVILGGTMALVGGVGTGVLTGVAVTFVALIVRLAWSPERRPLGIAAKVGLALVPIVVLVAVALVSA